MKLATLVRCVTLVFIVIVPLKAAEPETITNSLGMKLVHIPAGEFQMGAEEDPTDTLNAFPYAQRDWLEGETPRHRVRITKAFYMGAYEATLKEFLQFYHAAKYKIEAERDGKPSWGYNAAGKLIESANFRPWQPGWVQTQDHPVNYVSWNDAVAFCNWLSRKEGKKYRLPTEAEWEYACRAGTTTRYWCGNDPEELVRVGNVADEDCKIRFAAMRGGAGAVIAQFDKDGKKTNTQIPFPYVSRRDGYAFTAPVGKFRPNAFGLYDVHGNVWEWCSDWYDKDYYGQSPVDDPQGPAAGSSRVLRGGGWFLSPPVVARSASRFGAGPARRYDDVGFRVVRESE
jgi:formylglycine-generating enzyme required for sulfatase activity